MVFLIIVIRDDGCSDVTIFEVRSVETETKCVESGEKSMAFIDNLQKTTTLHFNKYQHVVQKLFHFNCDHSIPTSIKLHCGSIKTLRSPPDLYKVADPPL